MDDVLWDVGSWLQSVMMIFINIHWRGFGYSQLANLLAESVIVLMFYCSFFTLFIHSPNCFHLHQSPVTLWQHRGFSGRGIMGINIW